MFVVTLIKKIPHVPEKSYHLVSITTNVQPYHLVSALMIKSLVKGMELPSHTVLLRVLTWLLQIAYEGDF